MPVVGLRRLTRREYSNAIVALLGGPSGLGETFPQDAPAGPFPVNRGAPVSVLEEEKLILAAETASAAAVPGLIATLPCATTAATGCITDFIRAFGRRAYRRPLTQDEVGDQLALFEDLRKRQDAQAGLQAVVERFLQSPSFLYVFEGGTEVPGKALQKLSGYSVAARLAAFIWQSIPDDALLDAAAAGSLDTTEGVAKEALRLFQAEPARAAVADFHRDWLGLGDLSSVEKDRRLFPNFNPALAEAMNLETTRFVQDLLLDRGGSIQELLTSRWALPSGPLAALYQVPEGPAVDLPAKLRAGILTHPSFLATHAHPEQSSLVKRGTAVLTRLLCVELPSPPANVNDTLPEPSPNTSTRERVVQHRADPACAGCHVTIDEFGFAFESFDAIGQHRSIDGGRPVDTSGNVVGTSFDGPYQDASALMKKVSGSREFASCVVTQWLRFSQRRLEAPEDKCSLGVVEKAWATSGGRLRDLVIALVQSDGFRYRALGAI